MKAEAIAKELMDKVIKLNMIAGERGQTLAEMALYENLRNQRITTVLIGASHLSQIEDNVKALAKFEYLDKELKDIENVLNN